MHRNKLTVSKAGKPFYIHRNAVMNDKTARLVGLDGLLPSLDFRIIVCKHLPCFDDKVSP